MLAENLGFADRTELEPWAARNSDIWGNRFGSYMFNSIRAFLPEGEDRQQAAQREGERVSALLDTSTLNQRMPRR